MPPLHSKIPRLALSSSETIHAGNSARGVDGQILDLSRPYLEANSAGRGQSGTNVADSVGQALQIYVYNHHGLGHCCIKFGAHHNHGGQCRGIAMTSSGSGIGKVHLVCSRQDHMDQSAYTTSSAIHFRHWWRSQLSAAYAGCAPPPG